MQNFVKTDKKCILKRIYDTSMASIRNILVDIRNIYIIYTLYIMQLLYTITYITTYIHINTHFYAFLYLES